MSNWMKKESENTDLGSIEWLRADLADHDLVPSILPSRIRITETSLVARPTR
jgi:hypothetical protein